jgi:hypothetical protein
MNNMSSCACAKTSTDRFPVKEYLTFESRCGSVTIVTRLRAERIRAQFPAAAGNISLHHHVRPGLSLSSGHRGSLRGLKWPGREADHSLPCIAQVKNEWIYTSTPPSVFMAWYLIKHRDSYRYILMCLHVESSIRTIYAILKVSLNWILKFCTMLVLRELYISVSAIFPCRRIQYNDDHGMLTRYFNFRILIYYQRPYIF